MNLRDIKKDIEYVLGAFIEDCSLFSSINASAEDEKLSALFDEAIDLYNDLKDRVATKPEGNAKAYYIRTTKRNSKKHIESLIQPLFISIRSLWTDFLFLYAYCIVSGIYLILKIKHFASDNYIHYPQSQRSKKE